MFVCMLSASIGRTRTHGWAHSLKHARRETVGNTAPFAGQTDATDTPGHSGVPGSRMPVQPPEVRTDTWTRSAHDAHACMRAWTRTAHAQVTQRRRLQVSCVCFGTHAAAAPPCKPIPAGLCVCMCYASMAPSGLAQPLVLHPQPLAPVCACAVPLDQHASSVSA